MQGRSFINKLFMYRLFMGSFDMRSHIGLEPIGGSSKGILERRTVLDVLELQATCR